MAADATLVEVDLLDPELWKQENDDERERAFAYLREHNPVAFQKEREFIGIPAGPGFWNIVRNEDIRMISRDPATFSAQGAMQYFDWPAGIGGFYDSIVELDPPKHKAFRDIIAPAFKASRVKAWTDDIHRIVREVIADASELGECDFPEHFGELVPLKITEEMMGIPESYREEIIRATWMYLHCYDRDILPNGFRSVRDGCEAMAVIARELAEYKRREPGDDLTSALLHTEIEDYETGEKRRLTEDEYISFWLTMVTGGTETTRMTINHGMLQLTEHPDQYARWQADHSLSATGVEEMIRWTTAQGYFRRVVTQDTEVAGQALKAGDRLVLWYCSGNRDERAFENPHEFDITRHPNPHVSFGGGGPHFCIGAQFARLELRIFFEELFQLLPDLRISGPMERVHGFYMPDVKSMPCSFTPRKIDLAA